MITFQRSLLDDNLVSSAIDIPFDFIVDSLILCIRVRPFSSERVIEVCRMYINSQDFRTLLLKKGIRTLPVLIFWLFHQGIYSIHEIVDELISHNHYFPSLYFAEEIRDFERLTMNFVDRSVYHDFFSNGMLSGCIKYGFNISTPEYFLKYDLFESLQEFINGLDSIYLKPIEWSPFEWTNKPPSPLFEKMNIMSMAALYGSLRCFRLLMIHGYIINGNVVEMSYCGGNFEIIQLCRDFSGTSSESILNSISYYSQELLLKYVFDNDRYININDVRFPVHSASRNGDISMVNCLMQYGFNINDLSVIGDFCPLFPAIKNGNIHMVQFLVENKVNINHRGSNSSTLIIY